LEARRNNPLHCVAEYRECWAQKLREATDRIIEQENVLRLENAPGKKSAAA
jgi:hypothetical protein